MKMIKSIGKYKCPTCGVPDQLIYNGGRNGMCKSCVRKHYPPWMTLIYFNSGSFKRLWNLEIGDYEQFSNIEDIEWCGWMMRSKQDTLYSLMPRVTATVYHMEFFGDFPCGRCIDYPYFNKEKTCMAHACQHMCKPLKDVKDMQLPPVESRYVKWTGVRNA
jgi:hypothetical protein